MVDLWLIRIFSASPESVRISYSLLLLHKDESSATYLISECDSQKSIFCQKSLLPIAKRNKPFEDRPAPFRLSLSNMRPLAKRSWFGYTSSCSEKPPSRPSSDKDLFVCAASAHRCTHGSGCEMIHDLKLFRLLTYDARVVNIG